MGQTLRPYQQDGLSRILAAYAGGARSVLMVLPTGGGKTSIFATLAAQVPGRVLILVHRRELATQATNRLREFGADFGLIMAGEAPKPNARIQVASVQTLIRRKAPPAALVICDEAHLSTADTWRAILDQYPHAKILGVTATPWRMAGKPLIGAYDASVVVSTPADLRAAGYLCPYNGFSYLNPDLREIKTVGGEFNEQQSAAAMMKPTIVANVVEQWKRHASDLSTVVFAVTVEHSKKLTAEFLAAGVRAEHLDGATSVEARRAILARVSSGVTQVLCNVGVAVEGLDIPRLKCCVLARPTRSLARAIQMMGRVRRPWNGVAARIHDHAFVIPTHGLPDAPRDYTLSAALERTPDPEAIPSLSTCPTCFALFEGVMCPACGADRPVVERRINEIDDAEQVAFSSSDEKPIDVEALSAVDVKWDRIGREIEGVFKHTFTEDTAYGPLKRHMVHGAKRRYVLHGTTRLDALLAKVKPEAKIRVTFTGETDVGGGRRPRKEFKVEEDDERPCPRCGKLFLALNTRGRRSKRCSRACKVAVYRAKNPEKTAAYYARYRAKNPEKSREMFRASSAAWRAKKRLEAAAQAEASP